MLKHRLMWSFELWGSKRALVHWLLSPAMRPRLPAMPKWIVARLNVEPPLGPRSLAIPPLPPSLVTAPGVPRDPEQEAAAFAIEPLPIFPLRYPKVDEYFQTRRWLARLATIGMRTRALRTAKRAKAELSSEQRDEDVPSPDVLTQRVRERATELGLSAVGIAPYNHLYTFGPYLDDLPHGSVIVCVLEQNWDATQAGPSLRTEIAHNVTYARQEPMLVRLANYLKSLGYRAVPGEASGMGIAIHYGVEAGLGQLGLNGQLLTPFAGSRARLMLIHTDAPLVRDHPADYGIPKICDACQVCVRRCPSGAITNQRKWHRGVYKAKIKTERCLPIVAQLDGCALCMKTCPVQRYGLPAVIENFVATGTVLGKGTDELEGYTWPIDGKRYGPGEKPRDAVTPERLQPVEFDLDKPAAQGRKLAEHEDL